MASTGDPEENTLVQKLKSGDPQSYHEAVRAYTPGMLALARFYLDRSGAEDVVRDCWVTVIDAIHTFEGRSGLKTQLHRIVANRCKKLLTARWKTASSAIALTNTCLRSPKHNAPL